MFTEAPKGSCGGAWECDAWVLIFPEVHPLRVWVLFALDKSCVPVPRVPVSYGGEKAFSLLHLQWTMSTYQKQEDKHMNCCVSNVFG